SNQVGVVTLRHQTGILTSVAWHPDGLTLALGSGDMGVYLWKWTDAGSEVPRLRGHTGEVTGVLFLPASGSPEHGALLASCGEDGAIHIWDTDALAHHASLRGHREGVLDIAVSADGRSLASAGGWDRTVHLWDLSQLEEMWVLAGHTAQVTSVAFGAGGKYLCSGSWDETVRLWDPKYGREVEQLSEEGDALHLISSIAVAPARAVRGQLPLVATGDWSGQIRIWDLHRKSLLAGFAAHKGQVRAVAFDPGCEMETHGCWLASADDQGEICLWHAGPLSTHSGKADPRAPRTR
ncbi:MAG: WD40 repeat domain-containing protein, partial [Anaerolineae bacterium]